MKASARPCSTSTRVVLSGDLDLGTRHQLRLRLRDAMESDAPALTIDASAVTFIDCGSLRLIVDARRQSRAEGGSFDVVKASACVTRLARLAGCSGIVTEPAHP